MSTVYVVWGKNRDLIKKYNFHTPEEKDAFIAGVEAAIGWNDYANFDDVWDAQKYAQKESCT